MSYYEAKTAKGVLKPKVELYTAEEIDSFVQRSVVLFEGYLYGTFSYSHCVDYCLTTNCGAGLHTSSRAF